MAKHWQEPINRSVIHCEGVAGGDFTLCGDACDGETGDEELEETNRRVTCDRCIAIIEFCKTVRAREIKK